MSVVIRPETGQDQEAIWSVNQAAFEGNAEANLVDALRDGGFAEVSLVAEVDGEIVGHILFSGGHRHESWNGGRPVARTNGRAAEPPAARHRQQAI